MTVLSLLSVSHNALLLFKPFKVRIFHYYLYVIVVHLILTCLLFHRGFSRDGLSASFPCYPVIASPYAIEVDKFCAH